MDAWQVESGLGVGDDSGDSDDSGGDNWAWWREDGDGAAAAAAATATAGSKNRDTNAAPFRSTASKSASKPRSSATAAATAGGPQVALSISTPWLWLSTSAVGDGPAAPDAVGNEESSLSAKLSSFFSSGGYGGGTGGSGSKQRGMEGGRPFRIEGNGGATAARAEGAMGAALGGGGLGGGDPSVLWRDEDATMAELKSLAAALQVPSRWSKSARRADDGGSGGRGSRAGSRGGNQAVRLDLSAAQALQSALQRGGFLPRGKADIVVESSPAATSSDSMTAVANGGGGGGWEGIELLGDIAHQDGDSSKNSDGGDDGGDGGDGGRAVRGASRAGRMVRAVGHVSVEGGGDYSYSQEGGVLAYFEDGVDGRRRRLLLPPPPVGREEAALVCTLFRLSKDVTALRVQRGFVGSVGTPERPLALQMFPALQELRLEEIPLECVEGLSTLRMQLKLLSFEGAPLASLLALLAIHAGFLPGSSSWSAAASAAATPSGFALSRGRGGGGGGSVPPSDGDGETTGGGGGVEQPRESALASGGGGGGKGGTPIGVASSSSSAPEGGGKGGLQVTAEVGVESLQSRLGMGTPMLHWSLLETLSVCRCGLRELDPSLRLLPSVRRLSLAYNRLSRVDFFQDCASLEELDLSHNCLETVENIHAVLGNLRSLKLRGNLIERTLGLERMFSLEDVDLTGNRIYDLQEAARLSSLPLLRRLWLQGNPLEVEEGKAYRISVLSLLYQGRGAELLRTANLLNTIGAAVGTSSEEGEAAAAAAAAAAAGDVGVALDGQLPSRKEIGQLEQLCFTRAAEAAPASFPLDPRDAAASAGDPQHVGEAGEDLGQNAGSFTAALPAGFAATASAAAPAAAGAARSSPRIGPKPARRPPPRGRCRRRAPREQAPLARGVASAGTKTPAAAAAATRGRSRRGTRVVVIEEAVLPPRPPPPTAGTEWDDGGERDAAGSWTEGAPSFSQPSEPVSVLSEPPPSPSSAVPAVSLPAEQNGEQQSEEGQAKAQAKPRTAGGVGGEEASTVPSSQAAEVFYLAEGAARENSAASFAEVAAAAAAAGDSATAVQLLAPLLLHMQGGRGRFASAAASAAAAAAAAAAADAASATSVAAEVASESPAMSSGGLAGLAKLVREESEDGLPENVDIKLALGDASIDAGTDAGEGPGASANAGTCPAATGTARSADSAGSSSAASAADADGASGGAPVTAAANESRETSMDDVGSLAALLRREREEMKLLHPVEDESARAVPGVIPDILRGILGSPKSTKAEDGGGVGGGSGEAGAAQEQPAEVITAEAIAAGGFQVVGVASGEVASPTLDWDSSPRKGTRGRGRSGGGVGGRLRALLGSGSTSPPHSPARSPSWSPPRSPSSPFSPEPSWRSTYTPPPPPPPPRRNGWERRQEEDESSVSAGSPLKTPRVAAAATGVALPSDVDRLGLGQEEDYEEFQDCNDGAGGGAGGGSGGDDDDENVAFEMKNLRENGAGAAAVAGTAAANANADAAVTDWEIGGGRAECAWSGATVDRDQEPSVSVEGGAGRGGTWGSGYRGDVAYAGLLVVDHLELYFRQQVFNGAEQPYLLYEGHPTNLPPAMRRHREASKIKKDDRVVALFRETVLPCLSFSHHTRRRRPRRHHGEQSGAAAVAAAAALLSGGAPAAIPAAAGGGGGGFRGSKARGRGNGNGDGAVGGGGGGDSRSGGGGGAGGGGVVGIGSSRRKTLAATGMIQQVHRRAVDGEARGVTMGEVACVVVATETSIFFIDGGFANRNALFWEAPWPRVLMVLPLDAFERTTIGFRLQKLETHFDLSAAAAAAAAASGGGGEGAMGGEPEETISVVLLTRDRTRTFNLLQTLEPLATKARQMRGLPPTVVDNRDEATLEAIAQALPFTAPLEVGAGAAALAPGPPISPTRPLAAAGDRLPANASWSPLAGSSSPASTPTKLRPDEGAPGLAEGPAPTTEESVTAATGGDDGGGGGGNEGHGGEAADRREGVGVFRRVGKWAGKLVSKNKRSDGDGDGDGDDDDGGGGADGGGGRGTREWREVVGGQEDWQDEGWQEARSFEAREGGGTAERRRTGAAASGPVEGHDEDEFSVLYPIAAPPPLARGATGSGGSVRGTPRSKFAKHIGGGATGDGNAPGAAPCADGGGGGGVGGRAAGAGVGYFGNGGTVVVFQLLMQRWKLRPWVVVPRTLVATKEQLALMDEDHSRIRNTNDGRSLVGVSWEIAAAGRGGDGGGDDTGDTTPSAPSPTPLPLSGGWAAGRVDPSYFAEVRRPSPLTGGGSCGDYDGGGDGSDSDVFLSASPPGGLPDGGGARRRGYRTRAIVAGAAAAGEGGDVKGGASFGEMLCVDSVDLGDVLDVRQEDSAPEQVVIELKGERAFDPRRQWRLQCRTGANAERVASAVLRLSLERARQRRLASSWWKR